MNHTQSKDEVKSDRSNSNNNHNSNSNNNGSAKRVSFATSIKVASISPAHDDLSASLLAGSFTDSTHDSALDHPPEVVLSPMSDKPLRQQQQPKYSSLNQDDDDGPPPLEDAYGTYAAAASSSTSNQVPRRGSDCDNHSHAHGDSHSHNHGGRNARGGSPSSPRTPGTPGTPRRSPVDNCGGLKNRKKLDKAAEANRKARKQLGWAAVCCCIFMICEVIGGFLANSLAIMTDAAHLLSDLAGFLISIFALWLATRPATSRLSFGFHRAEILGALISVLMIWLLTGVLVYEACWRLAHPEDVDGRLMFFVALGGLVANAGMGLILMQSGHGHSHGLSGGDHDHGHSHGPKKPKKSALVAGGSLNGDDHGHSHGSSSSCDGDDHGHSHSSGDDDHGHSHGSSDDEHGHGDHHDDHENMNVKAALIHVLGDAIQSAGVMLAGGLIWYNPEWRIADPLSTFLFSILVLFTTTRLIKQSVAVLMEGVPEGLDPDDVEESLLGVPGVIAVHDLHIWSLSVGKPSLSVHLYCRDDAAHVLAAANKMCAAKYNIHHSTIQVERQHDDVECNDAFIPGHASLDRITQENFGALGLKAAEEV